MPSSSSDSRSSGARNNHRREAYLELTGETPPANLRTRKSSHHGGSDASWGDGTTLVPEDSFSQAGSRYHSHHNPRQDRQAQGGPIPQRSYSHHQRSRPTAFLPDLPEESLHERMERLDLGEPVQRRVPRSTSTRTRTSSSRHTPSRSHNQHSTIPPPASRLSRPATHIPQIPDRSQTSTASQYSRLTRPASHIPEPYPSVARSQSTRSHSRSQSHADSHSVSTGSRLTRSNSLATGSGSGYDTPRRARPRPETHDGIRLGRNSEGRTQWERSRDRPRGNGRVPRWLFWLTS